MNRLKFVADKAIPFLEGVLEPFADVVYLSGSEITAEAVKDADALIVRTRTKCNASLLEGSSVRMIATATIGTDHIDTEWCDSHNILVRNAAGCNAGGVCQYVFSSLFGIGSRKGLDILGKTIGIIGVGNVGRKVEYLARELGMNILRCDPPRAEAEGGNDFCSLDYLLANSDIVTMHVPLNDTTRFMCNADFFSRMRKGAIFINAARGEVVVDSALKKARQKLGAIIIDTWNNEPDIDLELLEMADIATPHIAGYSYQGKQNATMMAVRSVARFFDIPELFSFFPETIPGAEAVKIDVKGKTQGEIAAVFSYNYPIFTDDFILRMDPSNFENIRSGYNFRIEIYV